MRMCLWGRWGNLWQVGAEVVRERERRVRLALHPSTEQHRTLLSAERGDALLHLRTEVTHQTLDRPRCGVTQCADRTALDLFPR